ncbi:MAG: hypothetical protein MUF60_02460 [Vicinamibacterales bacterium]|jgi:hypothetical protein|nr:hypothetical protein [Vicinamibacterales bacterium]
MSSVLRAILPLMLASLVAAGCARPRPQTVEVPGPLEVPVVPPRVIAALPEEPEEAVAPADPQPRRATRPSRPRPRPAPAATDAAREQPPAAPGPGETPRPAEPQTVLRTPETVDDSEAARRVREALGRASGQLARVNAGALGRDARAQYDTARRFIDQAEGALAARNYMFASYLADKAETLARGLVGR